LVERSEGREVKELLDAMKNLTKGPGDGTTPESALLEI
jgi:hypothetical protein